MLKTLVSVLKPVVYAIDCGRCSDCDGPVCLLCCNHYADCDCIGPDEENVWYSDCGNYGFRITEE